MLFIERAGAEIIFEHVQRDPAGDLLDRLLKQQGADAAALMRGIDIELIADPSAQ